MSLAAQHHPRRGATLAETLISLGLFSLFILMATALFGRTFAYYHAQERPARLKQQAWVLFHRLSKAVRTCSDLREPDPLRFFLADRRTDHLVMRLQTPEGDRTIGYRLHEESRTIEEIVYRPDYLPDVPGTQDVLEGPRVVCREVNRFEVSVEDPQRPWLLTVELEVQPSKSSMLLRTRMNFRHEQ